MLNTALKLIRRYHNLTLVQASEKLGVSVSYLSEVERGVKTPSLDVLRAYSSVYGMPLSSIMYFAEQQSKDSGGSNLKRKISSKALRMLEWVDEVAMK